MFLELAKLLLISAGLTAITKGESTVTNGGTTSREGVILDGLLKRLYDLKPRNHKKSKLAWKSSYFPVVSMALALNTH